MLKASKEIRAQWWSDSTAKNTAAGPPGQDSHSQWRPIPQVSWPFYFYILFYNFFCLLYYFTILFFLISGGGGVVSRELFTESQEWVFLLLFILDLQSVNVKWDILHEKEFVFNYDWILNYDMSFSFLRVKEIGTACSIGTWTFNRNFLSEFEHKIQ